MPAVVPPVPPLVVRSDDGVLLFSSVAAARGYLEVPDVEAGVYGPAFDADGRLMTLAPPAELFEPKPTRVPDRLRWRAARGFNPVELALAEQDPTHQADLTALLRSQLGGKAESGSLEELLAAAADRFGVI